MKDKIFTSEFKTGMYDSRKNGLVTISSLFRILQETASEHHKYVDDDLLDLYNQGYGWFLSAARVELQQHPLAGEKLIVETWISEIVRFKAQREYKIFDQNKKLLAKAQKIWIFFDIKNRTIARVPQEITDKWPLLEEKTISRRFGKPPKEIETQANANILVRKSDLDINGHVNNIKYLEWLDEVARENYLTRKIKYFEGHFLSESKYGDKILIEAQDSPSQSTVLMTNTSSGKACFAATTEYL